MIFIVVKFTVHPERAEDWLDLAGEFTRSTREEPGNVFFEWSRSVDDPNTFVLCEGFASPEAGKVHVESEHFAKAMSWMPEVISKKPDIVNVEIPGDGWSEMGELTPVDPR